MASQEFLDLFDELTPKLERFHARTDIADFRKDWDEIFTVRDGTLPVTREKVDAGGVDAEWIYHTSASDSDHAVMFIHGGGFALGSLDSHRDLMARLSAATKAKVLGLGYRLAPEQPLPAANDDTETAWNWLLSQGYDASRLAIAGDSAGGGLVLSTALRLRDLGLPLPSSLVMFSPWVDLTQSGPSMTSRAGVDRMTTPDILNSMAAIYLQGRADPKDVRVNPLSGDFSNLPPMLVQVGDDEILYDDAARIVECGKKFGVEAELSSFPDMCHVFQLFGHRIPEAVEAIQQAGEFLIANFDK